MVRQSARLTESPVCLVADEGDMDMHLEKVLKAHKQLGATASQRILELNPNHALIEKLLARAEKSDTADMLGEAALLLLDQAYIVEGEPLSDPVAFSQRMASFMAPGFIIRYYMVFWRSVRGRLFFWHLNWPP